MIALRPYLKRFRRKQDALFNGMRDALLGGALAEGDRLPSSRELAEQLGIARGTVVIVYDMLASDGLIRLQGRRVPVVSASRAKPEQKQSRVFRGTHWAGRLPEPRPELLQPDGIDFNAGYTDRSLFPEREWRAALHKAMRRFDPGKALPIAGALELRSAVAAHVMRRRGMIAHPDQVAIVNGSIQAIAVLSQILLEKGRKAVIENPGYGGIRDSVLLAGAKPAFADVDAEGLRVQDWDASMCFVTPSRQFPTGTALSYERRLALARWAEKRRAVIVEDDYDSEFRRRGRPLEPLQCLAPAHVVHIGTFSRTLAVGLRLGYAILPESLVDPFLRARRAFETHAAGALEQMALAEFMRTGAYERHLRRAGREYARRHHCLQEQVLEHLAGISLLDSEAGLHAFAWWKGSSAALERFEERCRHAGVVPGSTRRHFFRRYAPSLIFSVAHLSERKIAEGIRIMKEAARG